MAELRFNRNFERRGPLWTPKYDYLPGRRYERYRKRHPRVGFTERQADQVLHSGDSVLTTTATFSLTPIPGNLICITFSDDNLAATLTSIKDGNGNVATVTPNSPGTQPGIANTWLAYLVVPATPSTSIVATVSANSGDVLLLQIEEFTVSGGPATFDHDVPASVGTAGTNINLPSITPTNPGSLVYAGVSTNGTISSPTAGASQGGWIGSAGNFTAINFIGAEYILSQPATAIAVSFTHASAGWGAVAMCFYIPSGSPTFQIDDYGQTMSPVSLR